MNEFIITGNIAKIYKNSPQNVKIVIADQYKTNTEFIPVMVFGDKAAWAAKWLDIGDHILAQGSIGSYDTGSGSRKTSLVAHKICFEGYPSPRRRDAQAAAYAPVVSQPTQPQPTQSQSWAKPVAMPDDLTLDDMMGGL